MPLGKKANSCLQYLAKPSRRAPQCKKSDNHILTNGIVNVQLEPSSKYKQTIVARYSPERSSCLDERLPSCPAAR
jgi:hypothetical protein